MGRSVVRYSPASPSWDSDWFEAVELVPDASMFDCSASDADSDDIVFGILFFSIVMVFVVSEGIRYGPSLRGKHLITSQVPLGQQM